MRAARRKRACSTDIPGLDDFYRGDVGREIARELDHLALAASGAGS